ncbi:MAG: hypothetical protein K2X99_08775 [Gemmatimonadaceae bacterium]|nr:hypothetical protein [Gemmatimonadaceae bacterium]
MSTATSCPACGTSARHCSACGTALVAGAAAPSRPPVWVVPVLVGTALLAFVAGQAFGGRNAAPEAAAPPLTAAGTAAGMPPRAPDISSLSPQERADRLFDRVMRLAAENKPDSVQLFAPMAQQAFAMMGTLSAHQRYDLGLLTLVAGDAAGASAEADTILKSEPQHLLGLVLAARSAEARGDTKARDRFTSKLVAVAAAERATKKPEYLDHAREIDAAIAEAKSGSKP